ncbi:MAG: MBOAT family O-acyltransferase [bacterium]
MGTSTLDIILPVGISFYTFQTLSYSIDVYRGLLTPTKDLISFLAFVSFFPQLVAGPIERAEDLLPQFERRRVFDLAAARDALRQILWGLVKKVLVADNLATTVEYAFGHHAELDGVTLFAATGLFFVQIYCDFSGYSDVAIGTARLLGFDLTRNFAFPFFSRDFTEFWRRWHISLNTWLRDYVFLPSR